MLLDFLADMVSNYMRYRKRKQLEREEQLTAKRDEQLPTTKGESSTTNA